MKFIALLPMKENSERVPQKNYRPLAGKPLFYYIADTLKSTAIFEKLVINTDSETITGMAQERYGDWVSIQQRPIELRGDLVSMNKIIEYDISYYGSDFHYLQTHSTNPFIPAETFRDAVQTYQAVVEAKKNDSLFSVNELKTRLYDHTLKPINHNPDELIRTQDLEVIYEENSNFYIFSIHSFSKANSRIGNNPYPYPMKSNRIESLDIDNPEEWEFAENLLAGGRISLK